MIPAASVWLTACLISLPAPSHASPTKSGNLFHTKLAGLLDEKRRPTPRRPRNLHEAKLSSLLQDGRGGRPPVGETRGTTQRSTKFPPWHFMHDYSNETFEGQTVDYNCWKRPMPSSDEVVAAFRKKYPRAQRPRYTGRFNFTEIGSIFEQAFIDGKLGSGDYDYLREVVKRNLSGIQITNHPFDYLTTRERKLKPWKTTVEYQVDPDYYNEIAGINTTYPAWLSTPINKNDDLMIRYWMFQQGY